MKLHRSTRTPIARVVSTVLAGAAGLTPVIASAAETSGLEEVIVTATRRETDLQKTPVAVTPINSEELSRMVGRDVSAITADVPNFSASRITAFNAASFAIRGVGQTDIIVYLDSPVAVNIDDFVMPSVQTQLLDTFDIEQVEVLRGPQGTLFGKNTTGGLVNVTTKRPVLAQTSAEVRALYGSFDTWQAQAALNYPAGDTLAFRAAVNYQNSDGYYENGASQWAVANGGSKDNVGGDDILNGRIKALWEPTEDLDFLLQYEFVRDRSEAVPSFNGTPREPGCVPFGQDPATGCTFVWNSLGITQPKGDPIDNMATTKRNDAFMATERGQKVDVEGVYLNADWDVGFATVSGVFGYRTQDSRLPNTYTGAVPIAPGNSQLSLFDASRDDDRDTYQYEVRLAGNDAQPFSWVVGAFYQENNATFCVAQVLGVNDLFGAPLPANVVGTNNQNPQVLCNKQDATSYAGFGDITWQATDKLSLGGGLRWTYEEKKWTGRTQGFVQSITQDPNDPLSFGTWQDFNEPLNLANFNRRDWAGNVPCTDNPNLPGTLIGVCNDEKDWSEPTYRATIGYQLTDDTFSYFKYDRGFKSGGYNDQTGTNGYFVPDFLEPYDPEYADSYELGLKTTFLDDRLRLNGALFYVNYDDAQRALVSSTCVANSPPTPTCTTSDGQAGTVFQETRFFNAAQVTVQGIELEGTWLATDNLVVKANVSYNDGEYDEFGADTNGDGSIDVDLSGLPLTRTPEWKWGLNGLYTHEAFGGTMSYNLVLYYEDENTFYYFQGDNRKFDATLNNKTMLDANITYTAADNKWFARLYGNNLLDERYRVASQVVANLWTHSQYGPPINFGLQVGMNFDFSE
jgi:iron complex outermembrane receptor protein